MKIIIKSIIFVCALFLGTGLTSCKKYLDKAPEASISVNDVFTTFKSFQGFTEEMYECVPDYTKATYNADWNLADELVATLKDWRMGVHMDNGDYWAVLTGNGWSQSYIKGNGFNTSDGWGNKELWGGCWYGIRKANLGLANLDKLVSATQEEKDIIKGELLFFRGMLHFQLMQFFGGLPYIDKVLEVGNLTLPRLSYQACAAKVDADLAAAALLLPANWDAPTCIVGQTTIGNNAQRVTKSTAYAYEGKNLLLAASPLMNAGVTGNSAATATASYNVDLCKQAAAAFAKCLTLSDNGTATYHLASWANYMTNFYTLDTKVPGYEESLYQGPFFGGTTDLAAIWLPGAISSAGDVVTPSADYVEYFGMANGLAITDAGSGYNPADPWTGRDPRFYKYIIYDGVKIIQGGSKSNDAYRYANLYTGGNYMNDLSASRTGYLLCKFAPMTSNNIDALKGWRDKPSYLRLADVYYMYAESVLWGYGNATVATAPGYPLTAAAAVNMVRNRATVPNIDARYLDTPAHFMDMLIKERAVELMCEANIRFVDLRRWLLLTDIKYHFKTAINFDRDPGTNYFPATGNPIIKPPINIKKTILTTRVTENKHYWCPLPTNQVTLYPGFGQNPGW